MARSQEVGFELQAILRSRCCKTKEINKGCFDERVRCELKL